MNRREFFRKNLNFFVCAYVLSFNALASSRLSKLTDSLFPFLGLLIYDRNSINIPESYISPLLNRRAIYIQHFKEKENKNLLVFQGYILTPTQLWLLKNYDK
jgi:hypothetical protein